MNIETLCPVCGFDYQETIYEDGEIEQYLICPSCGFEYGVTDIDKGYSYVSWRNKWVEEGMVWSGVSINQPPPKDWDPLEQLQHVNGIKKLE